MSALLDPNQGDSITEIIPEGLKFGGNLKSSIITNKSSVRIHPVGQQNIDSRYGKQLLFRIASSDYLIPQTACLNFTCKTGDKNIHLQEMCVSLLESIQLSVGGVEVEYQTYLSDLVKILIHHNVDKSTYESCMSAQLGAWKYVPRASGYVGTDQSSPGNLIHGKLGLALTTASNGETVYSPYEGQIWRDDSFPIADDGDGLSPLGDGRQFSIPLSLLLGFFRIKQMIPTFSVGSIDIKIDFAKFESACLMSWSHDRDIGGLITPVRVDTNGTQTNGDSDDNIYRVSESLKYYSITDCYLTCDFAQADASYNTLLASLISTQSVVMPFETFSTVARSFENSGRNTLLVSRGVSYLKQSHSILKHVNQLDNPCVMNDNNIGGDIFKSIQLEIGSKLYHPQKINSLIGMWREKEIAFEQYNKRGSGTCISYDAFCCKRNKFTGYNAMPVQNLDPANKTNEIQQPNLETKSAFIMSMNYEKLLGQSSLSGINSRLSGYNLHIDLELEETGTGAQNITRATHANYPWYNHVNQNYMLITFLRHDRSLILTRDTVQITE